MRCSIHRRTGKGGRSSSSAQSGTRALSRQRAAWRTSWQASGMLLEQRDHRPGGAQDVAEAHRHECRLAGLYVPLRFKHPPLYAPRAWLSRSAKRGVGDGLNIHLRHALGHAHDGGRVDRLVGR